MGFLPRSRRHDEYKDWGFRPVLFISLRLFILLLFIDKVYPNPLPLAVLWIGMRIYRLTDQEFKFVPHELIPIPGALPPFPPSCSRTASLNPPSSPRDPSSASYKNDAVHSYQVP